MMLVAMAVAAFTACEDVPEPYPIPEKGGQQGGNTEIEGATGTGTKDDPFNAAAALKKGKELASGEETADYYYIKGKVVSVKEEFTTQYGNGLSTSPATERPLTSSTHTASTTWATRSSPMATRRSRLTTRWWSAASSPTTTAQWRQPRTRDSSTS